MLLDNRLNTSSAHLSAFSWHSFKREIFKDKTPTLCQPLLRLGASYLQHRRLHRKSNDVFSNYFLCSKNSWFNTVVINNIFLFLCFSVNVWYTYVYNPYGQILHLACYSTLVPHDNSTNFHLNEFYCIQLNFASPQGALISN